MKIHIVCPILILLAMSASVSLSQSIDPVSSNSGQVVTIKNGKAKAGDNIVLLTSPFEAKCFTDLKAVPLEEGIPNLVQSGATSKVVVQQGALIAGNYLCALITDASGAPVLHAPQVKVTDGAASIDPVSSDSVKVTISTGAAKPGDTISLYSLKTEAACSTGTLVKLPNALYIVGPGEKTVVMVPENALKGGTYLCAVMRNPSGTAITATAPLVKVTDPPKPDEATIKSITPDPAFPNDKAQITGQNFGKTQGKSSVKIDGKTATVDSWGDKEVDISLPEGLTPGNNDVDMTVQNQGTKSSPDQAFDVKVAPWGDDDEKPVSVKFVGGYEEGVASSQAATSDAFVTVQGRRMFGYTPSSDLAVGPFYAVRVLSAPQTSSTNNIAAAVMNPSGTISAKTFSAVGQAVDLAVGTDLQLWQVKDTPQHSKPTSIDLLFGGGFTTPLQANTVTATFKMPVYGSVECSGLQQRIEPTLTKYKQQYMNIVPVPAPLATGTTYCYENKATTKPTQISTLVYAVQDTPNYYGKFFAGARILNWFDRPDNTKPCEEGNVCERGYAAFLVGEDASITHGSLRPAVFTIDSLYPMPAQKVGYLYLFGTIQKRFGNLPANQPPLILQTTITPNPLPTPSALVLPTVQPDRDFYRIGVGIRLDTVFTCLTQGKNCTTSK